MKTIAEISPARTWPILAMSLLYIAILLGLAGVVTLDVVQGRGAELWMILLLGAAAFTVRGLVEQVFLFLALFHGKGVLWLDDDRLVYLSGLFSQTNVADIAEATVESRRRGFGKLSYLVMTRTNGRQLFVPLRVCKRPAEDLLHDIAQLQGH